MANLMEPTRQMSETVDATGRRMKCYGWFDTAIRFGEKTITETIVIFGDVDGAILSVSAAEQLGIVTINVTPTVSNQATVSNIANPPLEQIEEQQKPAKFTMPYKPFQPVPTVNAIVSHDKSQVLEELLDDYADIFSSSESMTGEKFNIVLQESTKPVRVTNARHVPLALRPALEKEINTLLDEGILSKVTKPTDWVHPIVVQPKKGDPNKIRMCIDFRELNRSCKREHYPIPSILEVTQQIDGDNARIFSSFDAWKGYHQVELSDESKDLTTFITPMGRFRFEKAPYGINSISEHYERRMTEALVGVKNLAKVVDDNCIYSKDFDQHVQHVKNFFNKCRENHIRLNRDKIIFAQEEIKFAGVILTKDGCKMQPDVMKAIAEFPEPTNITELRSFQGMANQLAPFNPHPSAAMEPLRPLLKKDGTFPMNDVKIQGFKDANDILRSESVLAYYRPGAPMKLYTDASKIGFGFYLTQLQSDNNWKTIQCGSRSLQDAETRYAPIELELQALVYATRKCKTFLIGSKFTIMTDHKPLVSICNNKRLDEVDNSRIVRCLVKLMDFNFEVKHLPGSANKVADALSRKPIDKPLQDDQDDVQETQFHVNTLRQMAEQEADCSFRLKEVHKAAEDDFEYQLLRQQVKHGFPNTKRELNEILHPYWTIKDDLNISHDGFILKGSRLVIPHSIRKEVLDELHAGHRGIDGSRERARLVVYWPQIVNDIANKCRQCPKCEIDRPSQSKEPMRHFPLPNRAFEFISADWFDVNGGKFLVIVDWYSGWYEAYGPVQNADSARMIGYLRDWFIHKAVCDYLITDTGPPFGSNELGDFLQRWKIQWSPSSPYFAQGNGMGEHAVYNAKYLLRKCWKRGEKDPKNNDEWIKGLLQFRNTPNKSTGLSPAIMLFGHAIQDAVAAHKSALDRKWHDEILKIDREAANRKEKLEKAWNKNAKSLPLLNVQDPVAVQNVNTKRWDRQGIVVERNLKLRRYLIRLNSGLMIYRNRRHLRKRILESPLQMQQGVPEKSMSTQEPREIPVSPPVSKEAHSTSATESNQTTQDDETRETENPTTRQYPNRLRRPPDRLDTY